MFCFPSENKLFRIAALSRWHRIYPSNFVFSVPLSLEPFWFENFVKLITHVQTFLNNTLNIIEASLSKLGLSYFVNYYHCIML